MKKRIVALVLCGLLVLAGSTQSLAADVTTDEMVSVSPQMNSISRARTNLTVDSSGNAVIDSYVSGSFDITNRVKISAQLQKNVNGSWVTLQTFTEEKNSWQMSMKASYKVSKGFTYRVQATAYAYNVLSSESTIMVSNEVHY